MINPDPYGLQGVEFLRVLRNVVLKVAKIEGTEGTFGNKVSEEKNQGLEDFEDQCLAKHFP